MPNELVYSSLVRRCGRTRGKACPGGGTARLGKGGISRAAGGDAQGDVGREMIRVSIGFFFAMDDSLPYYPQSHVLTQRLVAPFSYTLTSEKYACDGFPGFAILGTGVFGSVCMI